MWFMFICLAWMEVERLIRIYKISRNFLIFIHDYSFILQIMPVMRQILCYGDMEMQRSISTYGPHIVTGETSTAINI